MPSAFPRSNGNGTPNPNLYGSSRDPRHEKDGNEKRKRTIRSHADLRKGTGFRKFSETPGQTPKKAYVLKEFTSTSSVGICSTRCLVTHSPLC
ncbi:unnamed protein product [Cyprideis torosa]|uniref:Uncharacterized protein n=1 Tax=Cyprideis torosa TaxID=163714 RepID=A0A7R8WH00_9CRUS|nr:unnamed protein product [Cyprideis torosa]CAG0895956.1 unnamed protein product [Cyprideis torosa]